MQRRLPQRAFGLITATALGLAALVPARAVVIPAGADAADDARREKASHDMGAKQTCVVGIEATPWGSPMLALGTGVYIGTSADGTKGLVLSAAHLFVDPSAPGKSDRLQGVILNFGPRMALMAPPSSSRIQVHRVVVHPDFRHYQDLSSRNNGAPFPMAMSVNDLALLEFDAAASQEALTKLGVQPAVLYDGARYQAPFLEALIVGFGRFATSTSPTTMGTGVVHQGHTLVTHATRRGRTAFMHWSPMSKAAEAAAISGAPTANLKQFTLQLEEKSLHDPLMRTLLPIKSHRMQALCAEGDSGSPLFFNTKGGVLKVAGIYSQFVGEYLLDPVSDTYHPHSAQYWEPVMGHAGWIHGVRNGTLGASKVLIPSNHGGRDGRGAAAAAPVERKAAHAAVPAAAARP
jgi:hypothetical protein